MYYGNYTSTDGTNRQFMSEPQGNMEFPPQVQYKNVSWRYTRSYAVTTPSDKKNFDAYVERMGIEVGVKIPSKKK